MTKELTPGADKSRSILDYMDQLSATVTGEKPVGQIDLLSDQQFGDVLAEQSRINRETRVEAERLPQSKKG